MKFFKAKKFLLKTSKGQVTVEYILLAVTLLVLMQVAFKQIKEGDYLKEFVSGPNPVIANMLENGVWNIDSKSAREQHPNHIKRHLSWEPL